MRGTIVVGGAKNAVLDGSSLPWADEDGVIYTGIIPFLLGGVMEELVE